MLMDYLCRCYLALIRGLHGRCPCPICLVEEGSLSDLSTVYPERSEEHVKALVEKPETKGAKEDILKKYGLRAVKVSIQCYQ
jgi:hypothetical protein